jgi:phosphoglycolate phosphatase
MLIYNKYDSRFCYMTTIFLEEDPVLIKAVVFDFDGTLFHFVLDYEGMRNSTRDTVIAAGLPASSFKEGERVRDIMNKMLEYANTHDWSDKKVKRVVKEINAVMDRYEWESAQNNSPVDGAKDVLRSLKKMGTKTGLLTNNSKRGIVYLLKKYKFSKLLDVVVTRNDLGDFNNLKPSPVGLNQVLGKLGVKASEAIYVGDSVVDVRAAISVGTTPVFVTTGYSTKKEIEENYPSVAIIGELRKLLSYLEETGRTPSPSNTKDISEN